MLEKQISQVEYRSGSQVVCHVPELGETQTWRMFDSLLSKALTSADGAGCSWSFKTRWGNDKKIRLQMADITQRFFRVRQHGGRRQGITVMKRQLYQDEMQRLQISHFQVSAQSTRKSNGKGFALL